jgi:hypothetical protein
MDLISIEFQKFISVKEIMHTNQNMIIFICIGYPKIILLRTILENILELLTFHCSYLI